MQTLDDLDDDLVEAIEDHNENVKLYNFILDSIIELAEEIATLETERSNAWNNYYDATAAVSAANTEIKRIFAEIKKLSPEDPECMSLWSEYYVQRDIKVEQEALADDAASIILSNTWQIAWKTVRLGFLESDLVTQADWCLFSAQKVSQKEAEFANLKTLIDQLIQEAIDEHVKTLHNGGTTHMHNLPE